MALNRAFSSLSPRGRGLGRGGYSLTHGTSAAYITTLSPTSPVKGGERSEGAE
jgi:hypothetical protein